MRISDWSSECALPILHKGARYFTGPCRIGSRAGPDKIFYTTNEETHGKAGGGAFADRLSVKHHPCYTDRPVVAFCGPDAGTRPRFLSCIAGRSGARTRAGASGSSFGLFRWRAPPAFSSAASRVG